MRILLHALAALTATGVGVGWVRADELAPLVEKLGADRFTERQAAVRALAEEAKTRFEEVVLALYSDAVQSDSEKRLLAKAVMKKAYERQVLGVGAPSCGWRLERFISQDGEDDRMHFSPIVGGVADGSPAAAAGLREGDEILTLDGEALPPVGAVALLHRRVAGGREGDEMVFTVRRWQRMFSFDKRTARDKPGEVRTVKVTLGRPADVAARPFHETSFASWVALEVDAIQRSSRPASQ